MAPVHHTTALNGVSSGGQTRGNLHGDTAMIKPLEPEKPPVDEAAFKPLEFERISVEEANKAIERTVRPAGVKNWEGERKPTAPDVLDPATAAWIASLPFEVRPRQLAREYPRIANKLCEFWKRPSHCDV